jgi:hypothetical protein
MAIAPSGTFDYVAVVPESVTANGFECHAALREPIVNGGNDLWNMRLVGHQPILRVSDAGLTPNPSSERPRVMRSLISLIAADRLAVMASASFHVDKALTSCLRAGDVLHLSRTDSGGIGLSVLRQATLVFAAGAVTAVTLGHGIEARFPEDLTERARAVFQERDEEFEFHENPVEIRVGASRAVLSAGRRTLEGYGVVVVHGFLENDDSGTDVCAAIYRTGSCPETAVEVSARLLDVPDALAMSGRP